MAAGMAPSRLTQYRRPLALKSRPCANWLMFSPLAFQAATRAFQISSRSMCRMVPERAWSRRDGAHAADTVKGGEFPPHWLYYINVKNVDEAAKRIPELGGKVITQPMDVPGGSRIINAQDPQGGYFALVSGGESK